ncbi:MAG: UbiA family prenyltransferase [Aliidongia sp.]
MGAAATRLIRPRAALILGRVSNLPTVLANALAGLTLSGAPGGVSNGLTGLLALTLFYLGGMYLNDAFDAAIDARERPARPIPRGDAARGTVFAMGFLLLALGLAVTAAAGAKAGWTGAALAAAILLYDMIHKYTALAPLVMGLCRLLSYITVAALAGGKLDAWALLIGASGLFCHDVGLTYAARQEAYDRLEAAWPLAMLAVPLAWALWSGRHDGLALMLWVGLAAASAEGLRRLFRRAPGDVPRAIALLIAAIALYDAVLIAAAGATEAALIAALCFPATLALQRIIPGT